MARSDSATYVSYDIAHLWNESAPLNFELTTINLKYLLIQPQGWLAMPEEVIVVGMNLRAHRTEWSSQPMLCK